jgi:hypothetical protein
MNITDIAREAGLNDFGVAWQMDALEAFATAIKAAHLAELTQGVEMPEPAFHVWIDPITMAYVANKYDKPVLESTPVVTLDQCQQAVAAAVARKATQVGDINVVELIAERDSLTAELAKKDAEIDEAATKALDYASKYNDIVQSITDPENQPSQYGTVTLAMYHALTAERDALAKKVEVLRDALEYHQAQTRPIDTTRAALEETK